MILMGLGGPDRVKARFLSWLPHKKIQDGVCTFTVWGAPTKME
jgi:hypothetical protein